MTTRTSRILLLAALTVVAGGGILGGLSACGNSSSANAAAAQPTAKVEKGLLRMVVGTTGPVVSKQDVPIKCKASGTVIKLPFDVSDRVKKDDILLQLDTDDQDRAVKKAKAVLAASEAQLEQSKQDLVVAKLTLATNRIKVAANLLMAEAKVREAKAKLERVRDLLAKKLASQEESDTAETVAATAEADLKNAQAAVEDLKTQEAALVLKQEDIKVQDAVVEQNRVSLDIQLKQLEYATVRSPTDGIVTSLVSGRDAAGNDIITRIGTIVQSGTSTVSGGTTVMTVADHSHMFVYANVPESDIGKVQDPQLHPTKPPQRVVITADAYPGVEFEGHVVRVADQGVLNQNVVNFEVRIEVDSPNRDLLKLKMTANVEIVVAEKPDVLLIPQAAFVRKRATDATTRGHGDAATEPAEAGTQKVETTGPKADPAGSPATQAATRPGRGLGRSAQGWRGEGAKPLAGTVQVVKGDGSTEARDVTVGLADTSNYEVLTGLKEGETVVVNKSGDSKWRGNNRPMGMMGGRR